jgi:hypothetical protein
MKKTSLLLVFAFLLQSCYSYKTVKINPKTMVLGQVYKIERNHKTSKVTYTGNADSAIVVLKNGVEEQIPLKEITTTRQQKFSLAKTLVWVPVTIIGLTVLFIYGTGDYDSE